MTTITRFNPNANGPLHLGHLYALLINAHYAHGRGGQCLVRVDDTNRDVRALPEARRAAIIAEQRTDIEWLGIAIDGWSTHSALWDAACAYLDDLGRLLFADFPENETPPLPTYTRMLSTGWYPAPYTPQQTALRVAMDHLLGVTHLIRGEELATETSLYCYYCDCLELPWPTFIYLPRLQGPRGDISKTNGGHTIAGLRAAGKAPQEVLALLAEACLYWRYGAWDLDNLRPEPRLTF